MVVGVHHVDVAGIVDAGLRELVVVSDLYVRVDVDRVVGERDASVYRNPDPDRAVVVVARSGAD